MAAPEFALGIGFFEAVIVGLCCLGPVLVGGIVAAVLLAGSRNRRNED